MSFPNFKVLIIEDFEPDRALYQRYLQADPNCTYSIVETDSTIAGLELYRAGAIDGILLDYQLPGQDGLRFLQALAMPQNDEQYNPPIIMVTGRGDEAIAVEAMKLGAVDYLVKQDLTPERLQISVRRAIETAQFQQKLQRDYQLAEQAKVQLLAEVEAARAEAETANRSKDEFVAIVAHELRAPLNSVLGWARLLQRQDLDAETQEKALDTIVKSTRAQAQLVDDLLDISRMVRGTLQLIFAPVNLAQVIEAALDIVRPVAVDKQIRITAQFKTTPQVWGDLQRLQQIVVNLLTNAIKFTPNQGQVDLWLEEMKGQVQLLIRDTGEGIAPDRLPLIFNRFHQGQLTGGATDGLGLGLAIVKHLVELHQGTIMADSQGIGQGATFTVRLPQFEPSALTSSTPTPNETHLLAGVRVLAVDDEPDMLNLIQFILKNQAAEVRTATTAAIALEYLSEFKPNLVVSDLAMPDVDGYEFVQQMRLRPEGQVPVIILTAYGNETYKEQVLQAGVQQYLMKPIDPDSLVAAILGLMHKQQE